MGSFRTLRSLDPNLQYVHIWNEPNAHFYHDKKNGSWYAEMYTEVATALKAEFPDVKLGGPVTFCPPLSQVKGQRPGVLGDDTWQGWFEPLLPAISTGQLDFMDYHAYQFKGTLDASGNATTRNLLQIAAQASIRTAITETNFPLEINETSIWSTRWTKRGLGLADQTMALLQQPDKVLTRQVFDWGVPAGDSAGNNGAFRFLPDTKGGQWTPEMELYRAFSNFSGALRVAVAVQGHSSLQVEAVCIDGTPGQCVHMKVALVNTGVQAVPCTMKVNSMAAQCDAAAGSILQLGPAAAGPQRSATACTAASIVVPANGMSMLECSC